MLRKILIASSLICVSAVLLFAGPTKMRNLQIVESTIQLGTSGNTLSNTQGSSGVAQEAGTVTATAGIPFCTDSGGNTTTTCPAALPTFVDAPQVSNVTIGTSATTIVTHSITMPSSGCPCRVQYAFSVFLSFAGFTDENNADVWITDGTTNFRGVETGQSNASTGAATGAAYTGWTTSTYSNSAVITFRLVGQMPGSGALAQAAVTTGAGANAGMTLMAFASN